jgi:hypothetical protein
MAHGLTEAQLNKRISTMGVAPIMKNLRHAERERRAQSDAYYNVGQILYEKISETNVAIADLERNRVEYGYCDEELLATYHQEVADLKEQREEASKKNKKLTNWPQSEEVTDWISLQRASTKWRPHVLKIEVPKGSTASDVLRERRADVDAIKAAIRGAEIAWLPEADAVQKAVAQIDKIAIKGAPDFRGLFRLSKENRVVRAQQGKIEWPQQIIGGDFHDAGFALTVWLHRDALIERAKTEIAALARPNSLSVAQRDEKIAALKVQLLEAERREEAAFLIASKTDPSLQRRPVDMRAFLQIEEAAAAPAEKSEAKETEFG